jgi:hypothetical protein
MGDYIDLPAAWWAENLEALDREIARLSMLCDVRILQPGVLERVLHKDSSVCGTDNPLAFGKLHDLIMLHFAIRKRSAESVGHSKTAAIENYIIERLRKSFPDLGSWPRG